MKESEKKAREELRRRGHLITKNGDGRKLDDLGAETMKHGLVSRILGNPPKHEKGK